MSADDPKPEDETPETPETPETLQDEQAEGGPPQEELDAEAPTTDAEEAPESLDPEPEDEAPKAAAKPKKKPAAKKAKADDAEKANDADDAEEAPKPKRTRAKKASEPEAEEAKAEKAKPAKAAPSANGNGQVVRAQAKYVRTSARKARLVCDHLRGKSVEEARAILLHTPRHVARDWSKLLESAVANAEHNHELVGDELRILSITADEGPTIKRFRPRAMGRASRIRKRTAHLSISLTSKES